METKERSNIIHVDFSRNNGPQAEGQSAERAPQVNSEQTAQEGSAGVTFTEGSTKIDARTGKGNIFKGVSQDNTSDSVWDKKRKFAAGTANPLDLVELLTEPLGQPRSRLAA